jgi:AraC-like DNA-binding protein
VLANDAVMRTSIVDEIAVSYELTEVSEVQAALNGLAARLYPDVIVSGCFTFHQVEMVRACVALARTLYEVCPWIPVVLIAEPPPLGLRADLLLTGVRAFAPNDFQPGELVAVLSKVEWPADTAIPSERDVLAVKEICAVLERLLTDIPALAALGAMVGMSRSHLSRKFHAVAGISLRDYVRQLRVKRAYELMRTPTRSLSEIATEVGFYDLPHFNKAFRHCLSVSPTTFRRAVLTPSGVSAR